METCWGLWRFWITENVSNLCTVLVLIFGTFLFCSMTYVSCVKTGVWLWFLFLRVTRKQKWKDVQWKQTRATHYSIYRRKNVHICINVYGGLHLSAKRGFALRTIGFFLCFFLPHPKDLRCVEKAVCDGGKIISLQTWKNVSCDMKYRCTKHKGPWLSKRPLVFFPIFFSLFHNDCGLFVDF